MRSAGAARIRRSRCVHDGLAGLRCRFLDQPNRKRVNSLLALFKFETGWRLRQSSKSVHDGEPPLLSITYKTKARILYE
jgi:hypothetical protein